MPGGVLGSWVLPSACVLALQCAEQVEPSPQAEATPYHGMRLLGAAGAEVLLGSQDPEARADEIPLTAVRFTDDFRIDTTEVTLAQYRLATGRVPSEYGDSLSVAELARPVCYVSWYDAVLYCNARSRLEGLDSVYHYARIDSLPDGRVYCLAGLSAELSAPGLRLPTEAEWEYAAGSGAEQAYPWGNDSTAVAAGAHAWFAGNADGSAHEVSLLAPNGFGLYDMAGNVMEWVHDVKGVLPGDTVADFCGTRTDPAGARPLKGGGWVHGLSALRIACRSDEYETVSASASRYIGFRCAAGAIAAPVLAAPDGTVGQGSLVYMLSDNIGVNTGGACGRLAFVNRAGPSRTLCWIDYCAAAPQVYEFGDVTDVYAPSLSPDGRWVAYGTAGEGAVSGSAVYVRRLAWPAELARLVASDPAFLPRWWIDSLGDTCVVYTTSAILNDSPSWASSQTVRVAVRGGTVVGAPVVVEPSGSYHGGLSAHGEYCAGGLPLLRMRDRAGGEERILFTSPYNGKPAGDTSQVCNVTISPDSSAPDRVLFMDFGSNTVSGLTGTAYRIHEYLFVGSYSRAVHHWYRVPGGYDSWDHPDWSNHPRCAVAAVSRNGVHPRVLLVDLADSAFLPLVEGEDLWHPSLWVQPGSTGAVSRDSAGRYNEPQLINAQAILALKMRWFWQLRDSLDVVFVGNSHIANAVDPRVFTGLKGFNFSANGAGLLTSRKLIEHYLLPHCPRLRLVGLGLPLRDMHIRDADNTWFSGMSLSRGFAYDSANGFWHQGLPEDLIAQMLAQPVPQVASPSNAAYDTLGLAAMPCLGWGTVDTVAGGTGSRLWTTADSEYQENIAALQSLAAELASHGVHLLVINTPQHPGYAATGSYGFWGPSQQTAREVLEQMEQFAQANAYVHFYDAHAYGAHDYLDVDAADHNHLCEAGAVRFSARIDNVMHAVLGY